MLQVKSVNGIEIPEWAECHCVVLHRPKYIHPIPYEMPDGNIMYFCPNTHHQVTTLVGLYKELGGTPPLEVLRHFNTVAQRMSKMCYGLYLAREVENES